MTDAQRQIWLKFYKAATVFRDLGCWEWMTDSDIFGVKDPVTGEIGYCCVMGNAGEFFALGVYIGAEGYKSYLDLLDLDEESESDRMLYGLDQKMLKVEFTDRKEVTQKDLDHLKALGVKFRGANQWITAREMIPGYMPWYIDETQAEFLTHCLHQAIDVAIRFEDNPDLLFMGEDKMLFRVPTVTKEGISWRDAYVEDPALSMEEESREVNLEIINYLKRKLRKTQSTVLYSLSYMPGAIKDKRDERPYFSKLGLWIDGDSGMITGFDMFDPVNFEKKFDDAFAQQMIKIGFLPTQILVDGWRVYDLLEPYAEALKIELLCAPDEPLFNEVLNSLNTFMDGMF